MRVSERGVGERQRGREEEGRQERGRRVREGKECTSKGEEVRRNLHLELTLQIPLVGKETLGGLLISIGK